MSRTKIICTLGPSTRDEKTITALAASGMNVARINFSHGTYEEKLDVIAKVRKVSSETGNPIAILGDLCGPKIRICELEQEKILIHPGNTLTITTREITGNTEIVSTTYPNLASDVNSGDRILIDDGKIELIVEAVRPGEVKTRVVIGGELKPHKGMNLPGVSISVPAISSKDFKDIEFAVNEGFDLLALSFVRTPDDVAKTKKILGNYNSDIPVIAKIEKEEAVNAFDEILHLADGIMIARGDLGVEIASEKVPLIQKHLINSCNKAGKPVITATQMLESMISNPRATRAETSDVANAVIDGSDAVMLSGETAVGKYPIVAVETMKRIIDGVEEQVGKGHSFTNVILDNPNIEDAVTAAACRAAEVLNAKVIVAYTQSGSTAMRLSKYRPRTRIIALTPFEEIRRRISIYWGIRSILVHDIQNTDSMADTAENLIVKNGHARKGDIIVITLGTPLNEPGTTNLVNVHRIK
jgi:pyruvate kinase